MVMLFSYLTPSNFERPVSHERREGLKERPVSHERREGLEERPVSHERREGLEEDTELGLTPDEDGVEALRKGTPTPCTCRTRYASQQAGVVGFLAEGRPSSRH